MSGDSTPAWDADRLANARIRLVNEVASDGCRLGLIVLAGDEMATRDASAVLEEASLLPLRRLAKLRPRYSEELVRVEDIIDFVEHYGHEYVAVALPISAAQLAADRAAVETVCRREGCDVLWHSTTP